MNITNPFAPHMTGQLSEETQALVAEQIAKGTLSPYACKNEDIIRRDSTHDQASLLRPAFMRDVEKIMHTPAYNRLNGKTQVFSFRAHDDITRRGLHEQLVCRVAKDIGRALGLNLDLIEAIALGHDVGHTPFGHAGSISSMIFITSKRDVGFSTTYRACACLTASMQETFLCRHLME